MAGDDQLTENLRARTWPGDCEAAAFRIEELRARVAELEAEPRDDLTYTMKTGVGMSKWIGLQGQGFRAIGLVFQNAAGCTGSLTEDGRVVWEQALAHPCQGHAQQQEAAPIIGLRSCNSLHGSDRAGTGMLGCRYRMRITDPGCTGCADRDEGGADHANELRRMARKIGHPAGDVPAVMRAAADRIDELERLVAAFQRAEAGG